jgi:hypothetical protein
MIVEVVGLLGGIAVPLALNKRAELRPDDQKNVRNVTAGVAIGSGVFAVATGSTLATSLALGTASAWAWMETIQIAKALP